MKIIFFIAFIFIIKLSGFSQSTEFFKTYNFNAKLFNLTEYNNSVYCNGNSMLANPKIFLLKTKLDGSFEDTATYGVDTGYYVLKNFVSLPNNKLIVLSQYVRSFSSYYKQYLLYIDTGLTKVKDSLYSINYLEFYGNVRINNNYYFTGGTSYDDNGDTIPKGNFLFLKTGLRGQKFFIACFFFSAFFIFFFLRLLFLNWVEIFLLKEDSLAK